ncbi:MAG TPA: hypothetical protein VJJ21_01295 [Candidatus Nanoarchaeia archaeon]|nr:hypothetical protein [Candidatus Nanoarchaeia archaeon]
MFKQVVFWCEFPETVDWKKAESLLKGLDCEIYVAVNSVAEYKKWKKKTKLNIYPWPVLSKEEGYWFSGFISKEGIDKLKQYKGLKIKIDLEPPLPSGNWGNFKIIVYAIKKIFQRGENNDYLKDVIYEVSGKGSGVVIKNVSFLINEFPFARWYLKKQGTHIEIRKGMQKNYMCYTSFAGNWFRPFARFYLKWFMRKAVKENKNISFSIGLIGSGILNTEGKYKNVTRFKQDLEMVKNSGCQNVAVYSIDSILKRENPAEWVDAVREFI